MSTTVRTKHTKRRDAVSSHYLSVEEREGNFKEVNLGYLNQDEVFVEANRCFLCRKPKCEDACPAHFNITEIMKNIQNGEYKNAAEVVNSFYCIPSSFNRICPAFCQDACIANKKGDPIQIVKIKRYLADHYEKPASFYDCKPPTGKKIAIIGSGPGGLTAAHELAKLGHEVTIFEKNNILGGMLAVGIPDYRLNNSLLFQEISDLENLGIKFETGKAFGSDFDHNDLFNSGYQAILMTIGAHKPKFMNIPGENFEGNIHAIQFLKNISLGMNTTIGKNVLVIGGGDVAIDAARTASRLGSNTQIIYRRSREEMPATKDEIRETENEKIKINFLTNPVEIIGENGKVTHIKLIKMRLGEPDESGRRRPIEIENSEFIIPVDTVIQAVSQEPESDELLKDGFKLTKWNTFEVEEDTYKTNVFGVFAVGDAVSGPKTAIEAIAQAKQVVHSINDFLMENYPSEESILVNIN